MSARSASRPEQSRLAGHMPLESMLDRVSDGIVVLDRDWKYAFINRAGAAMFGRTPDALIGKHIWTEFPEGVGQPFHLAYERAMATQQPLVLEDYYAPWDRWFENRIYPSPEGVAIFYHDITDRKRAEQAAREAAGRLQATIQATGTGLWDWDLRDNTVRYSAEWKRQLGYADDEISNSFEEWRSRVHPDDLPGALERVQRFLADPKPGFENEFRLRHRDGSYRWILARGDLIRDDAGTPVHMIGLHLDITDRKFEQQLLESQNEALQAVARGTPLPEVLDLLTRSAERVVSGALASVVLLDDDGVHLRHGAAPALPAEFQRAIDGQPIGPQAGSCGTAMFLAQTVVVEDVQTDPLWRDYRDTAARFGLRACWSVPIVDAQRRVLGSFALYWREPRRPTEQELRAIGVAADLAAIAISHARHEQALRTSFDRIRRLAAGIERAREGERARIARELHDELGQLLTGLKMDLAWITKRLPSNAADLAERAAAMERLLVDAVSVGRRIASELRPGMLDDLGLAAALRWVAREFERRSGLSVHIEMPDVLPVDAERALAAFRVAQEALTNVSRHANATAVQMRAFVGNGALELEIQDDGRGMPEHPPEGDTLGLIGMRERVAAWGGALDVRSGTAGGTTVTARIPLQPAP